MITITVEGGKFTQVRRPDAHAAVRDLSAAIAHDLKGHVPHEALPTTVDELVRLCVRMNWSLVIQYPTHNFALGADPRKE